LEIIWFNNEIKKKELEETGKIQKNIEKKLLTQIKNQNKEKIILFLFCIKIFMFISH